MGHRSTGTRLERDWNETVTQQIISFYLRLLKNKIKWQDCSISTKNKKVIPSPMFNYHSLIPWGSFRGWDHFGVDLRIISGLRINLGLGSFRGLYRSVRYFVVRSYRSACFTQILFIQLNMRTPILCPSHGYNLAIKTNWLDLKFAQFCF